MKRTLYGERDYAFGQLMLTLRTATGLTQAGLATLLGVSRHAVGGWEAGQSYPTVDHLTHFITLALGQHAFAAGREADEIRALWRAAHQKVLLDEQWLEALLGQLGTTAQPASAARPHGAGMVRGHAAANRPQLDWGDALDVPTFYGRAAELAALSSWILEDRCRVVSILGIGGIGKSALAASVMHRVATQFEVVIWRSLRDAPACDALLDDCLQVLAPQALLTMAPSLDARLRLLMEHLRGQRVLLVLDNGEVLLEEGTGTGRMRAGFEGYARLLHQIGETAHQSCLLLTSREKPADLVPLEGRRALVRTLRLAGLDAHAGAQVLVEKDVGGFPQEQVRLVEVYGGNPLALKIVAQSIVELFGGEIAPFLAQGEVVFGGVRELLREQFDRLSALEQTLFFWLAILREPVKLEEVLAVLSVRASVSVLEALDSLGRRSLLERGQRAGSFTLQSVVLEYATARLIAEASLAIEAGQLERLIQHGLCHAQAKEYVRQTQERLILVPLLSQLQSRYQGQAGIEARLRWLLDHMRGWTQESHGYGPANVVMLLCVLKGNVRGLDLSRLALRGVSLQGVEMQDANLSGAALQDTMFTEVFDAINAVATSRDGQYWAAASRRGDVRIWTAAGQTLHRVWQAHIERVLALAFSPDGGTLVSGSWDNTVKLWDVATGQLLWTGWHTGGINAVAFAPDGRLIASGGNDTLVQVWDTQNGTNVQTLVGQGGVVCSLAWSPDGRLLASGRANGSIRVWEPRKAKPDIYVQTLAEHTDWVTGVAFAPNGLQLASTSFDGTVKLWNIDSGACFETFSEHTDRVMRVAWSLDGRTVASCSFDYTIWLWDVMARRSRVVLRGHTAAIYSIAFTPDSRTLLSGSDDGTMRLWDVATGQCAHVMQGYTPSLFDVDWSPDGTQLASGGADTLVTIWDGAGVTTPRVLRGHQWIVQGVVWSPDGHLLASSGYDNSIGLWDTATGVLLQALRDLDGVNTIFQGVAWSPGGQLLACGSYLHGVQVWDMAARTPRWIGRTHPTLIRRVAWNPTGTRLAAGGDDGSVYLWDASDGTPQPPLAGHSGSVMSVAWSPDGMWLAAAGGGPAGGELFVWDANNGARVHALMGHPGVAAAVAWSPQGDWLISGSSDGKLRWWEVQGGACLRVQAAHQGTVQALKVSPDGSRLASCGDDGAIVLWDLHSGEQLETLRRDRPYERMDITGLTGVTDAQRASLIMLGAVEHLGDRVAAPAPPRDSLDSE